jgi:hypothetical protein
MSTVSELLDSVGKTPLRIVECGFRDTLHIARWVCGFPESMFDSVLMNSRVQEITHQELEKESLAKFCTFRTQSPAKFLSSCSWVDVIFLDSDDLQTGLEEFCIGISTGASLIVMREFQTQAALAVRKAQHLGWSFTTSGNFNILRRP